MGGGKGRSHVCGSGKERGKGRSIIMRGEPSEGEYRRGEGYPKVQVAGRGGGREERGEKVTGKDREGRKGCNNESMSFHSVHLVAM